MEDSNLVTVPSLSSCSMTRLSWFLILDVLHCDECRCCSLVIDSAIYVVYALVMNTSHICFVQRYLLRYKVLPATVIASLEKVLLNAISLSLNWKEHFPCHIMTATLIGLWHKWSCLTTSLIFFFFLQGFCHTAIKSEVWILRVLRGQRCITTRMTSAHKLLEHTERPRHWSS